MKFYIKHKEYNKIVLSLKQHILSNKNLYLNVKNSYPFTVDERKTR